MSIYRALRSLTTSLLILTACEIYAQSAFMLEHRVSLSDSALTLSELPDCTAILISSKSQCSNCSKANADIMNLCIKRGYTPTAARVVDSSWQFCKEDELGFKELHPGSSFFYLNAQHIAIIGAESKERQDLTFETSPVLLLINGEKVVLIPSEDLVDDYGNGRLKAKKLSKCK